MKDRLDSILLVSRIGALTILSVPFFLLFSIISSQVKDANYREKKAHEVFTASVPTYREKKLKELLSMMLDTVDVEYIFKKNPNDPIIVRFENGKKLTAYHIIFESLRDSLDLDNISQHAAASFSKKGCYHKKNGKVYWKTAHSPEDGFEFRGKNWNSNLERRLKDKQCLVYN